jgi:hypothetical protein
LVHVYSSRETGFWKASLDPQENFFGREMAHDVFICHSAKDKTTADAVCAMLESSGIRCWIAPRDVTAGMEWSECIIDAIEECRVMVLVFTTNANESSQIRREIERAVNRGVAILPLRIEDILPGRALEYFIGNVHWLDAMTPPLESHLNNLAGTVKILLGRLPRHDVPIPHMEANPPVAIPRIERTLPSEPTPERIVIPERITIPQPQPVEPIAPEKSEWSQPVRKPEPQEIPLRVAERREEKVAPKPASAKAEAAASAPSAVRKEKRAAGLKAIPIVVFLFSVGGAIGVGHDLIFGRFEPEMLAGVALCAAGIAASYGVFTKKDWGRILLIILMAACAIGELILVGKAVVDLPSFLAWICGQGLFAFIIWYMCTARVKEEFARASAERQKDFASNFTPMGAAAGTSGIASEISARGTGRRPIAVVVIAILSFVEAGIWMIPIKQALRHGLVSPRAMGAFLLVGAATAIGIGLIKLMGWARLLKVVVSAVDAILMISVAQDAFNEGGFGEVMWIVMFIYIIWSAWYLFAPRMKGVFSKAA